MISSGIAVDKTLGLIEDKDQYIVDNRPDDASIVDKSFSVLRLEDLTNGSKAGFTMGPARISTWVMVALLVLGATYPSLIVYRKLSRCYSKCKNKSGNADNAAADLTGNSKKTETKDSVEINIPTEKVEFQRLDTGGDWPRWSPEEVRHWDLRDSRILSAIEDLRSKYETDTGKDSANTDVNVSREEHLEKLDREIAELATARGRAVKDSVTE